MNDRLGDLAIPNHLLHPVTVPQPSMVFRDSGDGRTLVTIRPDGRVEYDPADLDEAAKRFWEAVSKVVAAAHEVQCPQCGTTIRARMADQQRPPNPS